MAPVSPKKTAISRTDLSRPVRIGVEEGLISEEHSFFDYGCGRGDDLRRLKAMGIQAAGWDPGHRPDASKQKSDTVNLGFVLNVVEDEDERRDILRSAWSLSGNALIVGARLKHDRKGLKGKDHEDGLVTSRGTFQKFFDQSELRGLIDQSLDAECLAAAPGIFIVFRDEALRQTFLARRQRRTAAAPKPRKSDILFEEHKDILEPLMEFYTERGRLPGPGELAEMPAIEEAFGTLRQAFAVIRLVTGKEDWARIEEDRRQDMLVYLALARLSKRPRMGHLSSEMQRDVRALFGTHKKACEQADELLFTAGDLDKVHELTAEKPFGKTTPDSFYIHISALSSLDPILRVYEGCARHYLGHVEDANIIKMHRHRFQVSYLSYPKFEREAHPCLFDSLLVNLDTLSIKYRDYSKSENPPVLHRKDSFIQSRHPLYTRFRNLTAQEERLGLLAETHLIGTAVGWRNCLAQHKKQIRGHRVVPGSPHTTEATFDCQL